MNNSLKQYIDLHDAHLDAINSHSAPQLNALRQEARKALDNAALPRKGSDDYEATDLNAVLAPDYGVNINHVDLSRESTTRFRCEVPNLSTCLYYVFNDTFRRSATAGQSGDNASVESFQATKHPQVLAQHYGSVARLDNTCTALNTMLAQDGVLIYVPKGSATTKPIQLINVFDANARLMAVRRLLIVLEDDAQARVLVCDHTKGDQQYLSLETVEIVVGRNAQLDYYHTLPPPACRRCGCAKARAATCSSTASHSPMASPATTTTSTSTVSIATPSCWEWQSPQASSTSTTTRSLTTTHLAARATRCLNMCSTTMLWEPLPGKSS